MSQLDLAGPGPEGEGAGPGLHDDRRGRATRPAAGAATAGPKYTVVQTDILSALVVDNSTNTVYFYTTEQGAEPGADLHPRGSLDLTQVGQPVLKPKKAAGAGGGVPKPRTDK